MKIYHSLAKRQIRSKRLMRKEKEEKSRGELCVDGSWKCVLRRRLSLRPTRRDVENEKKLGRSTRGLVRKESRHSLKRHLFLAVPRSPIKTNHDFYVFYRTVTISRSIPQNRYADPRLRSFENFIFALRTKMSSNQEISTSRSLLPCFDLIYGVAS